MSCAAAVITRTGRSSRLASSHPSATDSTTSTTRISTRLATVSALSWSPAELKEQAKIVADCPVPGDASAGGGEDVDLLLAEGPAGCRDALEGPGVPAGHDRRGDDGRPVYGCLAKLKTQVAEGIAQPGAGGEEACGPV
jgi:hypothetical protein